MRFFSSSFATLLALVLPMIDAQSDSPITGQLGNATVVEVNPPGVVYKATLPMKSFFNPEDPMGNIKGSISATAQPNGIGVVFEVNFSNFPKSGGPFSYHIHVAPVENDNCTLTLGHLDPYIRGETPPCNSTLPQTCQVGDLSGKYGAITSDPFTVKYLDLFASTEQGLGSFFGNRSVVIHFHNKTRITCASFAQEGVNGTPPTPIGSHATTTSVGPPTATNPSNATTTGAGPAQVTISSARKVRRGGSLVAAGGMVGAALFM